MQSQQIDFDPSISRSTFDQERQIALEVLNKVPRQAVIAGGAPRNWHFGNKAKDIDIYIEGEPNGLVFTSEPWWQGMPNARRMGAGAAVEFPEDNANPFRSMTISQVQPGESGSQKGIAHVHEFEYKGLKFQIITVKKDEFPTPNDNIRMAGVIPNNMGIISYIFRSFDFGINKIAIEKNGNIHKHYDFDEDVKNKTLTINMSEIIRYNATMIPHRFRKMKKYFPDHQVVIK